MSDDWLTEPFRINRTAPNLEDTKVIFAPQLSTAKPPTALAAPAPFADTSDIPSPYSGIIHRLRYKFPDAQLIAYKGVKTGATANTFKSAKRTFTKIRPITHRAGLKSFRRYVLGKPKSEGIPTAADFLAGYVLDGPVGLFVGRKRPYPSAPWINAAFLRNDYEYVAAPADVGQIIAFYGGTTGDELSVSANLNRVAPGKHQ